MQIYESRRRMHMAEHAPLALKIGLPVIEDLGIKLYGKLPPVMSEIVANSWDADAKKVEIRLPDGPIKKDSTITVSDDGTGMSYDDIAERYLQIGRKRRDEDGTDRSAGGRRIMGRKGIGKLSAFGAACTVTVSTTRDGRRTTFRMNIDDILSSAKASNSYSPVVIDDNVETGDADGTVVSLTELKRLSPVDPDSIRRGVARHFLVFGKGFEVLVDGRPIGPTDKVWNADIEKEWVVEPEPVSPNEHPEWIASGRIVASRKPLDEDDVGLAVMARGKLVQRPTTFGIKSGGKHTYSYIAGEITAEFLDEEYDMISTNRQEIMWEDARGVALREWGAKKLRQVSAELAEARQGRREREIRGDPEVKAWLDGLRGPERQTADKIIKILTSNRGLDERRRVEIIKYIRNSFDQEAFKEMIDDLREKPASATILSMFATWNLIEAREILRIVKGRMVAITTFAGMVDRGAREVPDMHQYFKKWPWIIDPAWTQWRDEVRYSKVLAEAYPREGLDGKDRQMDFLAIGVGDTIHVVEIKRPGHRVDSGDMDQLLDYVSFVEERLGNAPGGYKVVAGYIVASGIRDDRLTRVRVKEAAINRRYVRTYEDLIVAAKRLHEDYEAKLREFERHERGAP